MAEAFIIDCLRTPVGKAPRGTLRNTRPDDMAAAVIRALLVKLLLDTARAVVALPATHALADQTKIPLQALAGDEIILPSLDVLPFYEKIVTLCRDAGFEPKINQAVTVTGVVTLLSLVAAGVGVSILPNHVQTLHREGVVYRSLQNAPLNRQIAVVWRQEDSSIVLRQFLKVIWEVMNLSLLDSW